MDPTKFRSQQPNFRSAVPPADVDDSALARQIVRRRSRRRPTRGLWFGSAAALLAGVALIGSGLAARSTVEVLDSSGPELVLSTPIASARRIPEFLVTPVAARNLQGSVDPALAGAPPGTCVEYRDSSSAVASHNPAAPLVPASNMKVLTAAVAVEVLGEGTRLKTTFSTDGAPTDGATVKGNLYMVGGGDPLLTTDSYASSMTHGTPPATDLESVADQIVDTGIRHITGSVVGDESRYDAVRGADSWPERFFGQGQVGRLGALMVNDAWTPGLGPADNPALHAATVMEELLTARGVTIGEAPKAGTAPPTATTLVEIPSLTIGELAREALAFSDNTTTELLVKELGFSKGDGGSTAAGLKVMQSWIKSSGLPAEGVTFNDGSGLSDSDRLTCQFLSALIVAEGPTGVIADGLAMPGQPGTLQDRFLAEPLRGRIRAKTGSLRGVTSLSGWLKTDAGKNLSFSILINTGDKPTSNADLETQKKVLTAALGYPQSPSIESLSPTPPVQHPN
ncbi:MAG: D-alanyl-D-alanine carboxypeptidase [Microthrixaceae bacterium]